MNLVLVFPPLAEPAQPYSALPALTAFLKKRGWQKVRQMDVNIEFVRDLLTPERLEEALAKVECRLSRWDEVGTSDQDAAAEYALLVNAAVKAPFVVQGIQAAVEEMRTTGCFKDIDRLHRSRRLMHEALEIFSAAAFPLRLSYANAPGPPFGNPGELQKWVDDEDRSPFRRFFSRHTLPRLRRLNPGIVGISITYYGQVLPAVTLAALIKENLPGIPIVLGGNIVSLWHDTVEACPGLFRWCDYLIPFEGESALYYLLTALDSGGSLERVPNLVYFTGGIIKKNPVTVEEMDMLPTPDYRGLPLRRYLSPAPVFLLSTSRGCYWSKCRFCSVSAAMRRGYRARSAAQIHRDIVTITARHKSRYIAFGDDCVSPALLKELTDLLKKKGPKINWQCEVRFEKTLTTQLLTDMKETGCLNLIFGLESYSSRVLALMKKGVQKRQVERILGDCRRLGIAFNLQFFFGFPGESEADARETADFTRKQAHGAASFSFGTFELLRQSEVEKNPGSFHINILDRPTFPLAVAYEYTPVPEHAQKIRNNLRDDLYGNTRYSHAGLSITAHTLLFLHLAGVAAMGKLYEKRDITTKKIEDGAALLQCRLIRSGKQTAGTFSYLPQGLSADTMNAGTPGPVSGHLLLYDYPSDQLLEVSPLVVWLLKELDGSKTPAQVLAHLEEKSGTSLENMKGRESIDSALKELYNRGLLVRCPIRSS